MERERRQWPVLETVGLGDRLCSGVVDTVRMEVANQGELKCASSPVLPRARSEQVQQCWAGNWGGSSDRSSRRCPPHHHHHHHSRAGHTPHVFWLVQSEVDLVDLSSGDGVRGYEEADSCKSRGVTACGYRYPITTQELARPTSFLFRHPCLGTEVFQGLPYCPPPT